MTPDLEFSCAMLLCSKTLKKNANLQKSEKFKTYLPQIKERKCDQWF